MGHERLHQQAAWANSMLTRVAGPGGILEQIQARDLDRDLTPEQADDLADRLTAMAEHVRHTRAEVHQPFGILPAEFMGQDDGGFLRLPLNRKERYYTGTVLPMLVGSDGFAYLDRFLRRCGLDVEVTGGRAGDQPVDFYTEYGFAESVFTEADRAAWPDRVNADTPDVVIAGEDWLLAVEAKMFHNPSAADLTAQMRRQRAVVDVWVRRLGISPGRMRHVLLLPERLAERERAGLGDPVITWEQVLEDFWTVAPRYWAGVLRRALVNHQALESAPMRFGVNADAYMTGAEIVAAHADGTLPYDHIGRMGGQRGSKFTEDVATGQWRTICYEVCYGEAPNAWWFPIEEFLAAIAKSEEPS